MNHARALMQCFRISEEHPFVTMMVAWDRGTTQADLQQLMMDHREFFQHKLHHRGAVVIRGVEPETPERFQTMASAGLGIEPWNGFNLKGLPGFVSNWLRRYTEGLMGAGDYRRFLSKHAVQLGPVANSVQGPHVEGGCSPKRARYLALCCFEPAAHQAETGLVDLSAVLQYLPEAAQQKYLHAFNTFDYITARPLTRLDRLLVSQSPLRILKGLPDGRARLSPPPSPAVCLHPQTREPCLQPWAFARNTNAHAQAAAQQAFADRGPLEPCPNASDTHYLWGLSDANGEHMPWSDQEQRELFQAIYDRAYLMNWHRGDIALVDNVRIGHWRMNGVQGQRKLVQVQLGQVDASQLLPEELDPTLMAPTRPLSRQRQAA